jgi:hypothetical protein
MVFCSRQIKFGSEKWITIIMNTQCHRWQGRKTKVHERVGSLFPLVTEQEWQSSCIPRTASILLEAFSGNKTTLPPFYGNGKNTANHLR